MSLSIKFNNVNLTHIFLAITRDDYKEAFISASPIPQTRISRPLSLLFDLWTVTRDQLPQAGFTES